MKDSQATKRKISLLNLGNVSNCTLSFNASGCFKASLTSCKPYSIARLFYIICTTLWWHFWCKHFFVHQSTLTSVFMQKNSLKWGGAVTHYTTPFTAQLGKPKWRKVAAYRITLLHQHGIVSCAVL